jgi:hypothetical protein
MKPITREDIKGGGAWLAAARAWVQSNKLNGSQVTWGSDQVLVPPLTIRQVEEIAALVAIAAINEDRMKGK